MKRSKIKYWEYMHLSAKAVARQTSVFGGFVTSVLLRITGLYALRRFAPRGCVRLGRLRLPRLTPPTFLWRKTLRVFLSRHKNVAYSRNVKRHRNPELIGRPPRIRARRGEEKFYGWKAKSNLTLKK
jgi:hypothetical protein